jgi:hypothetical protein
MFENETARWWRDAGEGGRGLPAGLSKAEEGQLSNQRSATSTLRRAPAALMFIAAALAVSILLAACGGGDSNGNGDEPDPTNGGGGDQVGTEEFGMTDEELVTSIEAVESKIAECMDAAGFEYIPIDPVTFRQAMDSLTAVPGLTDEEFVEQYGFGLTTLPPTQAFRAGPDNQAIFESLSDADKVAYEQTLWGEDKKATFVVMLENEDFESAGGCTETAVHEVFTEEQLDPNFENPFDQLVAEDPRMVSALEAWSDCMSEAGYDYENEEDVEDEFTERLETLTEGADPATLEGSAKDDLTELQAEERETALAAFDCDEEHVEDIERQVEEDVSGRS